MYKYVTVVLNYNWSIQFMLFEDGSNKSSSSSAGNSLWGLGLFSLICWWTVPLIPGKINYSQISTKESTIDDVHEPVLGPILCYPLHFYAFLQPATSQLLAAVKFFRSFPQLLPDVFAFSFTVPLGNFSFSTPRALLWSLSSSQSRSPRKLFTILWVFSGSITR